MAPLINKLLFRSALILFSIVLINISVLYGQVTVVDYMKVKGSVDDYLQVEQEWKKLHQKSLESDKIYAWYLIQRHFAGTEDEYDFMTVMVYANMASIQTTYTESDYEGLDMEIINKTADVRDLVKVEIYDTPIILEVTNLPQYLNMSFMKVEQGNDEAYLVAEDEIWKPAHAELKKEGILSTWSVYRQLYPGGYGGDYNYVTVNGYSDRKKVALEPPEGWEEFMKKVHPDANVADLTKQTLDSRILIKNELWEIIDYVAAQ